MTGDIEQLIAFAGGVRNGWKADGCECSSCIVNKDEKLYLAELLKSCGLVPLGKVDGRNTAFSFFLQATDDFVPVFVPNIQSIRRVKVLTGIIGAARKIEGANSRKQEIRLVLSTHIANLTEFPPLYDLTFSQIIDRQYVDGIGRVMSKLPRNSEEVRSSLANDVSVGGARIANMIHQEN